jgi:3-oxoacyl-[acyl-carrier protein] reductase
MAVPQASERVALITGAGGGLGHALVNEFAAQAWRVVAASRAPNPDALDDPIWSLSLDVTDRHQAKSVVAKIRERWNRIDLLINNAGAAADSAVWEMDDAEFEKVLAVNLKGAFICSQMVLPVMLRQRDGQIVNISSYSGRAGARGQSNYAAAKAGLFALTSSLALEVGSRNIRVNAVLPGVLPTKMTSHLDGEQLAAFTDANALKRINSVEEVARFVAFLATTRNISGQIFQLDSRISPWS